MKKTILVFLFSLLVFARVSAQGTDNYVGQYAAKAQSLMEAHHLPASLILAVAIHESAAGKSRIAQYLNNHFGFKGKNSNTEIKSAYRDFPSVDSSYNHFITFLKSRKHFNGSFDKLDQYDYKAWARALQRGGYARSKTWAAQVIAIVKKHDLTQYDNRPEDYIEPLEKPKITPKNTSSDYYRVKKGDNLSIIAKRNQTTVKALRAKNKLKSEALQIGQKLKL